MDPREIYLRSGPILVRTGGADDVGPLLRALDDPSVTRWWPLDGDIPGVLLGEDADAVGLVVEVDGVMAGFVQYYEENDHQYRHAGIDIALGQAFQDMGVGTTVVRLVARYLFEELNHHRLVIDPNARNPRAIRAYEKAGFRRVGTMRNYEWDAELEAWTDGVLMEMLREDFDRSDLRG
jgi:aminoglycoside 6'-N-acetyltransferase